MKKLLALLLCVMLLVSVVPTAAFAMEENEDAITTIDLRPAYEARNNLYAAYGMLGAAVAAKNSVEGLTNSLDLFIPKFMEYLPVFLAAMGMEAEEVEEVLSKISKVKTEAYSLFGEMFAELFNEEFPENYPNGVSYETLFKIFGSYAVELYNLIGNVGGVGSAALAIDAEIVGVYNNLNGILNEFGIESVQPSLEMPVVFAD